MPASANSFFRKALRHSNWDALLIALSLVHGGVLLTIPSAPIIAMGLWWNSNTISHNFVHLPFFRSAVSNRCYSLYLSLLLGFPQSLWRDRHLAHHAGKAHRTRIKPSVLVETAVVFALWGVLLIEAPRFFWTVYLPGYVAGLALCYLHGYFEHASGAVSHYGWLYNIPFFNDGFHVEHHLRPAEHWTRLPRHTCECAKVSRWPAVLRWIEFANLEMLEAVALHSRPLQRMLLRTHERALRKLLPLTGEVHTVKIVGGGMFPRTAILLRRLLPEAEITILDANESNIQTARGFLERRPQTCPKPRFVHDVFEPGMADHADLLVIPLAFTGNRRAIYACPPARTVLVHDWIWSKQPDSAIVSPWLLKRINLVRR